MNHRKRHALVDIDGVLASFCILHETLNAATGRNWRYDDFTNYDLNGYYGLTREEVFACWVKADVIRRARPLDGAREAIEHLHQHCIVHLVTHREWHPQGHVHTASWLHAEGMPYDTLTVVDFDTKKSDLYRELADEFDFIFEDSLANVEDAIASGVVKQSIVIDHPWNRADGEQFVFGTNRFASLREATHQLLPITAAPTAEAKLGVQAGVVVYER